eukprot:1137770-Pelagomonas_calceolata.AAC.6
MAVQKRALIRAKLKTLASPIVQQCPCKVKKHRSWPEPSQDASLPWLQLLIIHILAPHLLHHDAGL